MHNKTFKLSHLQNESRQKNIYSRLFKQHGKSHQSLHWTNRKNQQLRFEAFLSAGNLQGASLLDIGCGFGDFLSFLKEKKINCFYTGFDICEEFITTAQKNFPDNRFELRNILLKPTPEKFNYVFMSGIFAFGDAAFFRDMLRTTFETCSTAIGFNIHETMHPNFFKISKKEVETFCESLGAKQIVFCENYLKDD